MDDLIQECRVESDYVDGDEDGREWKVQYVLYKTLDDEYRVCYDIYTDDGLGNGVKVCRGYNANHMRSMTLQLGRFIEWKAAA